MDSNGIDDKLLQDVVKFLSFQASVISGNSFNDDDPRFNGLSPRLRERIQISVNRPALERLLMFGWNKDFQKEANQIQRFFEKVDEDGGGVSKLS